MSIYNLNAESSKIDRNQLTKLIPLVVDWLTYHSGEPFDIVRAEKEFQKHAAAYHQQKVIADTKRANQKEKNEQDINEFHRNLGEPHFEALINSETLGFGDVVTDPETHESIGVVRELFPIGWTRPNFDVLHNPSQKSDYLCELKRVFDGVSDSFIHTRKLPPRTIAIESAPFSKRPSQFYSVSLRLRWKAK